MKRFTLILSLVLSLLLSLLFVSGAAQARPNPRLLSLIKAGSVLHQTDHHGVRRKFPVTIVDDLGNHVRIAQQPARIVSLDPRDTETLFALGLEKRVVGDGGKDVEGAAGIHHDFRYPSEWPSPWGRDYPIRAKQLAHVEGGFGTTPFSLETIESLHPDLIFSLNDPSQAPTYQKIRDLGIKLIILDPANIHGILHDIALVGRAAGHIRQASVVSGRIRKQLQAVRGLLAHVRARPRVYYEIDATNPTQPYTAGPGTFIDEAIHLAGGTNVADAAHTCSGKDCYPRFSLEALVQLNPQIILLGDAAYGTTAQSVRDRDGWQTIAAVQTNRIYPFDDELISRAGPRIAVGVRAMARLIHPEAFRQ